MARKKQHRKIVKRRTVRKVYRKGGRKANRRHQRGPSGKSKASKVRKLIRLAKRR